MYIYLHNICIFFSFFIGENFRVKNNNLYTTSVVINYYMILYNTII